MEIRDYERDKNYTILAVNRPRVTMRDRSGPLDLPLVVVVMMVGAKV